MLERKIMKISLKARLPGEGVGFAVVGTGVVVEAVDFNENVHHDISSFQYYKEKKTDLITNKKLYTKREL